MNLRAIKNVFLLFLVGRNERMHRDIYFIAVSVNVAITSVRAVIITVCDN